MLRAINKSYHLSQLIPQFFFICLGMGGAFLYLFRLARGPHVTLKPSYSLHSFNKINTRFDNIYINYLMHYIIVSDSVDSY
uniref:Uncharacterized protein n=1 Tax=Sinocyclocheilus rhinocerous TaxID=307959 RepID=A0A673LGF2_9TELE